MATVGTIMTITDLSGNTYNIHGMLYGQCDTAATTQAKTVAIPGITNLATGLSIRVRFVYGQAYNGVPTLNVNNLGAKNIRRSSASDAAIYEWVANEILDLVYDGTYWVIVNGGKAKNNERGHATVYNGRINSETLRWQRFNDYIVFVWVVAKTSFIMNNGGVLATGFPVPSSSANVDLHITIGPKVRIDNSGQLVLSEDVAQNIWISAWGIYETGNQYF